ncbi:7437_t:CDS:2, partial [Gigaspora rosea]
KSYPHFLSGGNAKSTPRKRNFQKVKQAYCTNWTTSLKSTTYHNMSLKNCSSKRSIQRTDFKYGTRKKIEFVKEIKNNQ